MLTADVLAPASVDSAPVVVSEPAPVKAGRKPKPTAEPAPAEPKPTAAEPAATLVYGVPTVDTPKGTVVAVGKGIGYTVGEVVAALRTLAPTGSMGAPKAEALGDMAAAIRCWAKHHPSVNAGDLADRLDALADEAIAASKAIAAVGLQSPGVSIPQFGGAPLNLICGARVGKADYRRVIGRAK